MDEEDEYDLSDDAFDLIPDTTLRELEQNAILSTQQHTNGQQQQKPTRNTPVPNGQTARAQTVLRQPVAQAARLVPGHQIPEDGDSFDYMDEDGIATPVEEVESFVPPHRIPSEMSQREQWRRERFGKPQDTSQVPVQVQRPSYQSSTIRRPQATAKAANEDLWEDSMIEDVGNAKTAMMGQTPGERALLAQVAELSKMRDQLATELNQAKLKVTTQQGEISIIRDNKNKESKLFDRQLNILKKSMQEESAKHRATLQALTEKSEKIADDNKFLKHDLDGATARVKVLQTKLKERPVQEREDGGTTTPKKAPANSLRDGFDDDEMMVFSPTKSARRSKTATPTAAGKRKRKSDQQSPIRPLALRMSGIVVDDSDIPQAGPQPTNRAERTVPVVRKDFRAERNLKFVQRILNYQPSGGKSRLIETLMKFAFPGDPAKPFSTIVLDSTAKLKGPRLPADTLQIFIDLWARSIKEKYYDCVKLLLETVDFIIELDMSVLDKGTLGILLPVLQDCARINGVTRFEHSPVNQSTFGMFRPTPQSALNHKVDGTACLELLYKIACIVEDEFPLIDLFWRSMSTDFVLMMLNPWQPISDITLMFHLLSTSIFPNTFGNICPDEQQQSQMEAYIVDRVCYLLWETPKVDEGLEPLTKSDITNLRLEAMSLLTHLAITSSFPPMEDNPDHHGSLLLAHHPSAIARIVRSLYDEVSAMYLMTSSHALHAELVNRGVRLLYHLTRLHGDDIDMQKKLSAVNGGVHKHRVVLTRLAFSEGIHIDKLITDETVVMATSMLEESVTPDEADQLVEAFPNFRGRKDEA